MENRPSSRAFCRTITDIPAFFIPPAFIAKHGVFFPKKLSLELDHVSGISWPVKAVKNRDGHYKLRTANWHKFMKDNDVQFSDTVVFSFVDHSRVVVTIFDAHGCKKEYYRHPLIKFTFTWGKHMRNCMLIKGQICKALRLREQTSVEVRNINGREYEVNLFKANDGRVGFGYGWARFVEDNNMVEDRMYQFECSRMHDGKTVFQLSLIADY